MSSCTISSCTTSGAPGRRAAFASALSLLVATAVLGACTDVAAPPPPVATSVALVAAGSTAGIAGAPLAEAASFRVLDQYGAVMVGAPVSVAVTGGGGTISSAPTVTVAGATPMGSWTLGTTAGGNTATITVGALAPLIVTARGGAGAPARLVALPAAAALTARVAEATGPIGVRLADANDNAIAGAVLEVKPSAGSAAASVTTDSIGVARLASWTLGTVAGAQSLAFSIGAVTTAVTALAAPGDPAVLAPASGTPANPSALAATAVAPQQLALLDRYGNAVGGITVSFAVSAGTGSLAATAAATDSAGTVSVPTWTLGKSAGPQRVRASAGALSAELSATVKSDFDIDVRFFGTPMTAAHRALFSDAAARLRGFITGDIAAQPVANLEVASACGATGVARLTELVDDLVIFASIQNIDGPGKILAQAGPCYVRSGSILPIVGVMEFDAADLELLSSKGSLENVIMHEMLHVIGLGTIWRAPLLQGGGTNEVRFEGSGALQGCRDAGALTVVNGTAPCQTSVPVENGGGPGTRDGHWRESTFVNELMTGFLNQGVNPLSAMTIRSLGDLGYTVNPAAFDSYRVPGSALRAGASALVSSDPGWERAIPVRVLPAP